MREHAASILTAALFITFFALSVEHAAAMSRHHHNNDGGGSHPGVSENVGKSPGSDWHSIDAQPYITPIPEPSTVVLLGSGVAALGLWRWQKKQ
ncbi:MAG: PEP-CTERM sorting domain-containing protein [Nitrospirota bacterium]|nr:PEP-CTERM sorting domain-containing protein [Nitrospirota bacterium]